MNDISVIWLNYNEGTPNHGYWCYGWLEETLINAADVTQPCTFYWGSAIDIHDDREDGAIVIIPAEYNAPHVEKINIALAKLPWCVLILASDERGLFPIELLDMTNVSSLWVMTPHFEKHVYPPGTQFMGEMYPQQARDNIHNTGNTGYWPQRPYQWSFSGQITHERRYEMVAAIEDLDGGKMIKTAGFTQGLPHNEYYELLTQSVSVLAPSGPVTPDSFRAFEALEAGCIPILDGECPTKQDCERYWKEVLGDAQPLPVVHDWNDAADYIEDAAASWPTQNIRISSWWQMYKRDLKHRLLSGIPGYNPGTYTILMPTSVIPSHPSMAKIEAVLASVRFHHPDADIIIMCDGVRDEQLDRTDAYETYLAQLLDACNFKWRNVYPLVFDSHQHQANMTRWALDHVHTPLVLFVEHDIQMVTDMPIDWDSITALVESGDVDVVKFSFEAMGIHPEHEWMALDPDIVIMHGCPVRRSVQWSQRPHVATTDFYRRIIQDWFPESSRTMIEDKMHSVAQEFPEQFRLASYIPLEGSAVRCFHIDGREGDEKYEMVYE